jgi:hypothetical protein
VATDKEGIKEINSSKEPQISLKLLDLRSAEGKVEELRVLRHISSSVTTSFIELLNDDMFIIGKDKDGYNLYVQKKDEKDLATFELPKDHVPISLHGFELRCSDNNQKKTPHLLIELRNLNGFKTIVRHVMLDRRKVKDVLVSNEAKDLQTQLFSLHYSADTMHILLNSGKGMFSYSMQSTLLSELSLKPNHKVFTIFIGEEARVNECRFFEFSPNLTEPTNPYVTFLSVARESSYTLTVAKSVARGMVALRQISFDSHIWWSSASLCIESGVIATAGLLTSGNDIGVAVHHHDAQIDGDWVYVSEFDQKRVVEVKMPKATEEFQAIKTQKEKADLKQIARTFFQNMYLKTVLARKSASTHSSLILMLRGESKLMLLTFKENDTQIQKIELSGNRFKEPKTSPDLTTKIKTCLANSAKACNNSKQIRTEPNFFIVGCLSGEILKISLSE